MYAVRFGVRSELFLPEMNFSFGVKKSDIRNPFRSFSAFAGFLLRVIVSAAAGLMILYGSLIFTSEPLGPDESEKVAAALQILESKGFHEDATVIRERARFRRTDHWLNVFSSSENAYASTNYPFGIVTVYRDFFEKASDDTERAAILLHEAQHLLGKNETEAYRYVWRSRREIGWTQLAYGTSPTYVAIELQTREAVPELFSCTRNLWNDCTEILRASR